MGLAVGACALIGLGVPNARRGRKVSGETVDGLLQKVVLVPRGGRTRTEGQDGHTDRPVVFHKKAQSFGKRWLEVAVRTALCVPICRLVLHPGFVQHVGPIKDDCSFGARSKPRLWRVG